MKNKWIVLTLSMAALFATACFEEEDSCNIRTPGIYVEYEVVEEDGSARAQVTFWTGDDPGGTYLELGACGDTISVNGEELSESGSNPTRYRGVIDVADSYEFVFDRPDEGSYASTVTDMPAPVAISAPSGQSIARDESFEVIWDTNGSGQINLLISGDCIHDYPSTLGEAITDNGTHTVAADALEIWSGEEGSTCSATVELTRTTTGDLSPDLKGTIVGKTRDTASFSTTAAAGETGDSELAD